MYAYVRRHWANLLDSYFAHPIWEDEAGECYALACPESMTSLPFSKRLGWIKRYRRNYEGNVRVIS